MKLKEIFKTIFITIFAITIYSCSDDDDSTFMDDSGDTTTIADFVAENADYSSLLAALEKAELTSTLASDGNYTVFAPNNAAFDAFLSDLGVTLDDLTKDDLTPILLNHVIGGSFTSSQLTTGYLVNLADVSTYVNVSDGVTINGDATVTQADVERSNGIIHAIDKVIPLPTLLTFVAADPELSSLAVTATTTEGFATDFAAVLGAADSDLTLLAPDNDAFTDLGDISGVSTDALEQILLNHVIAGGIQSSALSTTYSTTLASYSDTDNNISIYINTDDGVAFNGISSVSTADIIASNGVIHIVDTVITIPSVVTFATADPNFSTLVSALTELTPETDFAGILSTDLGTDPAPFTVFAPTNTAFDALDAIPSEDPLTSVLQYHVVSGVNVRAEDLTNGQVVTTLETGTFTVNIGDDVTITDEAEGTSTVTATNVQASNGVIHVIDTVLIPDSIL
ncbi:fasciclin domain-containing protein [Aquimarina pacifica]|uniref:fasciclin domain-containing protein n=1 Tax=Aquimarina pacifica TaxID=1296415 RepID=UPI0004BC0406|nr:fasciclin domain-containing protein [Aquimarina pacifica]